MSSPDHPALMLIDIQKGLDLSGYYGGNRNNPNAEENAATLLAYWRRLGLPIFHIMHSSQDPKSPLHASNPGFDIKEEVKPLPNEPVIVKNVNSAFINTNLLHLLQKANISTVVIAGLTTNHCISSTVRMASDLGLNTYVIADATATFNSTSIDGRTIESEVMHQTALASLKHEYATITDTQGILTLLDS